MGTLENVFSEVNNQGGVVSVPTNGTDFPFFPRKPSFQAILTQLVNNKLTIQEVNLTSQKTWALCSMIVRARNTPWHTNLPSRDEPG